MLVPSNAIPRALIQATCECALRELVRRNKPMRKLIAGLIALACSIDPALAQQAPSFSIAGSLPAGANVISSVGLEAGTN